MDEVSSPEKKNDTKISNLESVAVAYLRGGQGGQSAPLTSDKQKKKKREKEKKKEKGGKRREIFFCLSARILSKIRCGNKLRATRYVR